MEIKLYGQSIFCPPHRPNFSDIFDICLHWVSVVREPSQCNSDLVTDRGSVLLPKTNVQSVAIQIHNTFTITFNEKDHHDFGTKIENSCHSV